MTNEKFQEVVARRKRLIDEVLSKKADEYARGDRLSNFKSAAQIMNCNPMSALVGMMVKHEISFHDFVNDWQNRAIVQPYDRWDEKIGDMINYLILADAIIREYLEGNEIEVTK
jgi:hypothetical protein